MSRKLRSQDFEIQKSIFKCGAPVKARWKDGKSYPAIVKRINGNTIELEFMEDAITSHLKYPLVEPMDSATLKNSKKSKTEKLRIDEVNSDTEVENNKEMKKRKTAKKLSSFSRKKRKIPIVNKTVVVCEFNDEGNTRNSDQHFVQNTSAEEIVEKENNECNLPSGSHEKNSNNDSSKEETSDIKVITTNNLNGKRKWDKKYFCLFCSKSFSKLPRHLVSAHREETEVKQLLSMKNDKSMKMSRQKLMVKLRNLGNHKHNVSVLKGGAGKLIVTYRPTGNGKPSNYVPCPSCYGYYSKRELWKHKHKCVLKEGGKKCKKVAAARALSPSPAQTKENVKHVHFKKQIILKHSYCNESSSK